MIDRATIDRIIDTADIVEVVSEFVSLQKRGTSYKGLCPFHDDRTPSFSVSPSRGVYKCFACGKAGNAVNFVMEHEQMTYVEALKWLARKYNIEIKERELSNEEKKQQSERESVLIVNEWAADYYEHILHEDSDGVAIGMQYWRKRGFRDDVIQRFRLGFAPVQRDALPRAAINKGYKAEYLIASGLCGQRENGELYDRFAGRVIFPWFTVSGKVVAFGGRLLDSRTKGVSQKYVNSPDSPVYHKDHELYGIFQAKKAIAKFDCVYMVEGYTDVISMHQCGIENVVANSGTALSVHQIRLLHRFTSNIVLLYDGDEAGIHAAMRGTDMLLAEGMNVRVLLLPDQEDPDSFARNHTAADFRTYIEEHQTDFMEFKTNVMLQGVTDPVKRSEAINSIVKSISVISDPIKRATFIKDCSQRIGIAEKTLISQMNRFIRQDKEQEYRDLQRQERQKQAEAALAPPADKAGNLHQPFTDNVPAISQLEYMIVQEVVRHGELVIFYDVELEDGRVADLTLAEFVNYDLNLDGLQLNNPLCRQILEEAVAHVHDTDFVASRYFSLHPDVEVSKLGTQMATDQVHVSESLKLNPTYEQIANHIQHMLSDFRLEYVNQQLKQLKNALLTTKDIEQQAVLQSKYMRCLQLRTEFAKRLGRIN
jgi:DNA primase